MSARKCNRLGNAKRDSMRGDSFVMAPGEVIPSKQGGVGVAICEVHSDEYRGRVTDVGCEHGNCYSKRIVIKIGDKAIRERSEHIGVRITQGATDRKTVCSVEDRKVESQVRIFSKPIAIVDDEGTASQKPGETEIVDGRPRKSINAEHPFTMAMQSDGRPTVKETKPSRKESLRRNVYFGDPADKVSNTSSGREEDRLATIWRGEERGIRDSSTSSSSGGSNNGRR